MVGCGEHLYGIDKDDILQHRGNASATTIIGKFIYRKLNVIFFGFLWRLKFQILLAYISSWLRER
jgi:hypothetical protein